MTIERINSAARHHDIDGDTSALIGSRSSSSSDGYYSAHSTSLRTDPSDTEDDDEVDSNRRHQNPHEAITAVRCRDGRLGSSHFRLLRPLGKGGRGTVYLAELLGFPGTYFAIKMVDKDEMESRETLKLEREIMRCLDHPFLPTLFAHIDTDNFFCLVMDYCPAGDLHALRQKQPRNRFSEHAARFYATEVLLALEYLHNLGIIYRDLKPENVLLRADGHIMLSDFDLSLKCPIRRKPVKSSRSKRSSFWTRFTICRTERRRVHDPVTPDLANIRSMSFVGTLEYMAPEIIKKEGHGSAVDWWSFGIFLYELMFGITPFEGTVKRATMFNVVREPLKFPEVPNVSSAVKDLISGLLVKKPRDRLGFCEGANEVKQHPFFQNVNWERVLSSTSPEGCQVRWTIDGGGGGGSGGIGEAT